MVNNSHSPIPQVEENKKQYTALVIKRDDIARQFHNITGQPMQLILLSVDNNILQHLPILREDIVIAEDIYWSSVPHLQGKTVWRKVQYVEHIVVQNVSKWILDGYNNLKLCHNLMHINKIAFLKTIYRHILFSVGSIIKTEKWRKFRRESSMPTKCTWNVVSISPTYMLIVNLNHYGWKWLILESPSNVCQRSNMSPIFNGSTTPSSNVSDMPMPFTWISKLIIVRLVATAIFWLN